MTNEIKEILDYLKDKKAYAINEFGAHKELTPEENNKLVHYITNLQQRIDKAIEYIINHTQSTAHLEMDTKSIKHLLDILRGDE